MRLAAPIEAPAVRRLAQLYAGLVLYGASMALMIRADLGLDPWNAFHQGLSEQLNLSFGTIVIGTGVMVMLLWIPLREKPGVGTLSNIVVLGLVVDGALAVVPALDSMAVRLVLLPVSILLTGVATAAYIGAGLGPGPRDGLMTGLCRRTGWSVRVVRTSLELGVLAVGWLLGGTVGVGTVLFALAIGPVAHHLLPHLTIGRIPS